MQSYDQHMIYFGKVVLPDIFTIFYSDRELDVLVHVPILQETVPPPPPKCSHTPGAVSIRTQRSHLPVSL